MLDDSPKPLSSFLILEFVEGRKLDLRKLTELSEEQQTSLYTSLADIYIQLRRLEFPSIGCLLSGSDGILVNKKTTSLDINMQELEGLQPSKIQASYYSANGHLISASKYVDMLLEIADNAFAKGRGSVLDEKKGSDALYHLHLFRKFTQGWVDPSLDQGPFVMVHGDLEPYNLIVDENMSIVSVLDWEWSRIVPRQFFVPPLWLDVNDTTKLALKPVYGFYLEKFDRLLEIVRNREIERFGEPVLADEWTAAKHDSGFLVANALENWTDMDWFAHRYINRQWFPGSDEEELAARVEAFMEDPAHRALITSKLAEGRAYQATVERLKRNDAERLIINRMLSSIPTLSKITWWGAAALLFAGTCFIRNRMV